MRVIALALISFGVAACKTETDATAAAAVDTGAAEVAADVTRIVREFAEDPNAAVKLERVKDIMACGTVATNGTMKRFSVDLVDEEAFFDEGDDVTGSLVGMAC